MTAAPGRVHKLMRLQRINIEMTVMAAAAKTPFALESTFSRRPAESLAYALTSPTGPAKPVERFPPRRQRAGAASIPRRRSKAGRWSSGCPTTPSSRRPTASCWSPARAWTVTARGLSYPLRHWTDGANGRLRRLRRRHNRARCGGADAAPSATTGPLKRGAEIYPVPDEAPVPVCRSCRGRKACRFPAGSPTPAGLDLSAEGRRGAAAAASLPRARRQPVSRRRHRAPGGRGRASRHRLERARGSRPRPTRSAFRRLARRSARAPAPACSTA